MLIKQVNKDRKNIHTNLLRKLVAKQVTIGLVDFKLIMES